MNYVLAEIGFNRFYSGVGESVIEFDLLGHHRLAFHGELDATFTGKLSDVRIGLFRVAGPEDVAPELFYFGSELPKIMIEGFNRVLFDPAGAFPQMIPFISHRGHGETPSSRELRSGDGQRFLQLLVRKRAAIIVDERLRVNLVLHGYLFVQAHRAGGAQ